ncbi:MAG: hypothetical protein ACP5E3_08010 [Bacteroidales bacterium]
MKFPGKPILIILFLFLFASMYSQNYGEVLFIDFETPDTSIRFVDPENNCWIIGEPDKSLLATPYSGQRAIMTDTLNPYPPGNRSSFTITIPQEEYFDNSDFLLEFYHYLDCDTLIDSAYVDFSFDGGQNWYKGADRIDIFTANHMRRYFYGSNTGGNYALDAVISGNSAGWIHEKYQFTWYYALKKSQSELYYPDSIIIRWNFISQDNPGNKDGWMIDDIYYYFSG